VHRHHGHHHRHGGAANPLLWYLRSRLRRRLFAWFGVAILVTAMVSGVAVWVLGGGPRSWHDRVESLQRFVGQRFALVWHDEPARDELARSAARDLGLGLRLLDVEGSELASYGPSCRRPHEIEVVEGHKVLGRIEACVHGYGGGGPAPIIGTFVIAAIVLWLSSGLIAYRLTRPLAHVVKVTREIGEGKLDARVPVKPIGGDELQVIAEAVNDMAARIETMMSAERELLASVSHEIRTPLGHIRVLLDVARQGDADPKFIEEIEREVVAIDNLVGQLLARSRVAFGTIDRRELDAVEVAIRALERGALDPTLLEAEAETLKLRGDAALVLQALANMLRNAEEHGGGATRLWVHRVGESIAFDVEDAGSGFDELEIERAFESFHRGAQEPKRGSLGLGLALVRRIARAHGGDATLHNLRPGARVRLLLPTS
jgi:two-component system OmpR family sensor kinase